MSDSYSLGKIARRIGIWAAQLTIVLVVLAALPVLLLYFGQHSMIYHPRPYTANYAKIAGFEGMEISYTTAAGPQTAYFVPAKSSPPDRLWIAFCGNGSLALDWMPLIQNYPAEDVAFLLIDYPGYGRNSGHATIEATRSSAEKAWQTLRQRLGLSEGQVPVSVIGHSLGSAAAFDFAAHHRAQQVVAIAPFTSLQEEAATMVGQTLSHLLSDNYDNRAALKAIFAADPDVAIAIFHGIDDGDIPERMSETLAREFPRIRLFPVAGADHVTVLQEARSQILGCMTKPR